MVFILFICAELEAIALHKKRQVVLGVSYC